VADVLVVFSADGADASFDVEVESFVSDVVVVTSSCWAVTGSGWVIGATMLSEFIGLIGLAGLIGLDTFVGFIGLSTQLFRVSTHGAATGCP
jgi:hypothetical protein